MEFLPPPPPPPYSPFQTNSPPASSKQHRIQQGSTPDSLRRDRGNNTQLRSKPILREPQRTNPIIWCVAIFCLFFSILLISFGIVTLIIFIDVKPRVPAFDIPAASLSVVYFYSPELLNGELVILANFSNPNRKLEVTFRYLHVDLCFGGSSIASQVIQSLSLRPKESRLIQINFLSSLVHLPSNLALELRQQEEQNRILYSIKGKFRVIVRLGLIHYSYWLHGECNIEMSSAPTGTLITHICRMKR